MRFDKVIEEHDFLKEETTILGDPVVGTKTKDPDAWMYNVDRIVEEINKDCSQILRYYKTMPPLFRGVPSSGDPLLLKSGYINRAMYPGGPRGRDPRDTPEKIHNYINGFMKKKIGWPMRDGVPVTTHYTQARSYGFARIFFPFNGFKFAYIPKVRDLFLTLDQIFYRWTGEAMGTKTEYESRDKVEKFFNSPQIMKEFEVVLNKVETKKWIGHPGEIFFNTKKYYLFDPTHMGFETDEKGNPVDRSHIVYKKLGIFSKVKWASTFTQK